MCGIAGIWSDTADLEISSAIGRMTNALRHRGPDASGLWTDVESQIALGHRRLSILDLSELGAQPMVSKSKRYTIVFNGEIYNFQDLKKDLDNQTGGLVWMGHSDTEVLLAAIEVWGLKTTLSRLNGMFAFALWDSLHRNLVLARDRIGEKPLYYGYIDKKIVFASELKAIQMEFSAHLQIDRQALAEFMRFSYIPAPMSIYQGIKKLLPGHMLIIDSAFSIPEPVPYWASSHYSLSHGANCQSTPLDGAGIEILHQKLADAVKRQMVADVSLGAFLSGGIDSSLIVSLMQSQSEKKINTFTIGFNEASFDEAPHAAKIAKHLGTNHTEFYLDSSDALSIIADLPQVYDEPFADSSQIPSILVSQLTKEHVSVALSGDGGDELFAGYPRYQTTAKLWQTLQKVPTFVRRAGAHSIKRLSAKSWDQLCSMGPGSFSTKLNGRRIHKMSDLLMATELKHLYIGLMSHWQPSQNLVLGTETKFNADTPWPRGGSWVDQMRRWDMAQYLPDDLLVKVDRASMSTSLEVRAPLLDYEVTEFALSLTDAQLIDKSGLGKSPLRQILGKYVPVNYFDRPKSGFSIPLAEWLRGPLRDWAENLLEEKKLLQQGFLDVSKVRSAWQEHVIGDFDRSIQLWNVLVFQQWFEQCYSAKAEKGAL